MVKVSWQLIYSQKKWFFFLLLICVMTIVTTALFQIIATTTEKYTIEQAQAKYGDFTGLLIDTDENEIKLNNSSLIIGEYGISEAMTINQNLVQVGFFDEKAFQMANFQLLKGRLPEKSNEAVIEAAYLQNIYGDTWGIGTRKQIGHQDVLLVGVIKNYSANWAMNIDVHNQYYGFPNIIQLKNLDDSKKKHSYIIKNLDDNMETMHNNFSTKYGLNYMVNDQFYYKGLKSYKVMNLIKYFFLTALLMISSVSLCQIILIYYKKQEVLYRLLKVEGMTKRKIEIIKVLQILWVIGISSILSIPITYIIYKRLSYYLYEYNLFIPWDTLFVAIAGSIIFFTILLVCMILLLPHRKKIRFKSQTIMYGLNSTVLVSSIILLFTSIFVYKEEIELPQKDMVSIAANRVTQTMNVEGFDVALPPRKYIPASEVEKINKYTGVSSVQVTALTDDLKLYISRENTDNIENASVLEEASLKLIYSESNFAKNLQVQKSLLKNHAILIIPSKNMFDNYVKKIGSNLIIVRSDAQGILKFWTYKIATVKVVESKNSNPYIAINAQKAIQRQLFNGYNDIEVYLNPAISEENRRNLVGKLSSLSALYNDEIVEINNHNPLSKLFKAYYMITFIVSILFVCITTYFMLDLSLERNSRRWGIYLSQGMTKYRIWMLLVKSIPLLWIQTILISSVLLLIIYINQSYVNNPLSAYKEIFIVISLCILILFLIVSGIFYIKIYKLSIIDLLKNGINMNDEENIHKS